MTWRDDAVCVDLDVDVFFAGRGELYSWEALTACDRCPVWEQCLRDALTDRDTICHGYRAGTTPRTRQRMARDPWFLQRFISDRRARRRFVDA